jgi:isocitrate lyase
MGKGSTQRQHLFQTEGPKKLPEALRKKRLMSLVHLYLVHRYKADSVHYVTPTEDNQYQAAKMQAHGIFSAVNTDVGQIIVADVDRERTAALLAADRVALGKLIRKEG